MTPYERRIASLRTIPPAEIAAVKRQQHARLSRIIYDIRRYVAAVPLSQAHSLDGVFDALAAYEKVAFAMIEEAVELEIVRVGE